MAGIAGGTTIKNDALYEVLSRFRKVFEETTARDGSGHTKEVKAVIGETFDKLLDQDKEGKTLAKKMSGTLIRNLLEFGRSVHAEMAALMDASLRGVSVKGGTLYCTTFPCHLCARHIVAAGITRVVYIEPYPKSLAGDLYSDSLQVDPVHPVPDLVSFEPFVGISPWKYFTFFRAIPRKDDDTGKNLPWSPGSNTQRFVPRTFAYRLMECAILGELLPKTMEHRKLLVTANGKWLKLTLSKNKKKLKQCDPDAKPDIDFILPSA